MRALAAHVQRVAARRRSSSDGAEHREAFKEFRSVFIGREAAVHPDDPRRPGPESLGDILNALWWHSPSSASPSAPALHISQQKLATATPAGCRGGQVLRARPAGLGLGRVGAGLQGPGPRQSCARSTSKMQAGAVDVAEGRQAHVADVGHALVLETDLAVVRRRRREDPRRRDHHLRQPAALREPRGRPGKRVDTTLMRGGGFLWASPAGSVTKRRTGTISGTKSSPSSVR